MDNEKNEITIKSLKNQIEYHKRGAEEII